MTDRIEPALAAEQWATLHFESPRDPVSGAQVFISLRGDMLDVGQVRESEPDESVRLWRYGPLPQLIALANAALPDTDPRKITLARLRNADAAFTFLAALESYLPPGPEKPAEQMLPSTTFQKI